MSQADTLLSNAWLNILRITVQLSYFERAFWEEGKRMSELRALAQAWGRDLWQMGDAGRDN